ncbi:MAG: hypothetical protein ABJN34_04135 [Litoreibacter sp.]|uniref:hypothetical protein n=1 Tax=Litoreibacter sp. TaxID=1969459 RepID=UPI00329A150A
MKRLLMLGLTLTTISACGAALNSTLTTFMVEDDKTRVQSLLENPEELSRFLSNTTIKDWDDRHGTQIEYHSTDGRTWLVYPGNTRAVQGQWQLQSSNGQPQMCYLYGTGSYNPVTRRKGGNWECTPAILTLLADEVVDGDVLRLQGRGAFPQQMPPRVNVSISEAMAAIGLQPLRSPNKVNWEYTR